MQTLQRVTLALVMSLRHPWLSVLLGLALSGPAVAQPGMGGEYQVYPLRHKPVADVEKLLTEMLADLDKTTHVVADLRENQILLRGPEKAHEIARQLIDSVDRAPAPAAPAKPEVKAYPCPASRLTETADRLRRRYAGQPGVRVATDAQNSQLLVLAPPEVHLAIAGTVAAGAAATAVPKAGPEAPASRLPQERFVAMTHSRADRVEPQLRRLLGSRLEPLADARPGRPRYLFVNSAGQRVELAVDHQRNGMAIVGEASLTAQFTRLIQALDALDAATPGEGKTVRIVPVHRADPAKVRRAVDAYRSATGRPDELPRQTPTTNNPGADETGRRPGARAGGVELVQWLAQADAVPGISEVERIGAAGDEQAPGLPIDSVRELGEDVEIETLPDLDVIIVRGRDRDIEEVSRIIAEIERLSAITEPVIDIYLLEHVAGEPLVEILDLAAEDLAGGRQGSVHITALVKPNALLLIGWGEALDAIKELVAKLDQPVPPQTQLRVFALRRAPATTAATTLEDVFQERGGLSPQVEVDADPRTNSLIVRAAPRDMAEVELLVNQLDRSDSRAVNQARVIKLENSLADDLAATLQDAIEAATGDGDRRSAVLELLAADVGDGRILKSGILADVEITPDPHTNTLIVSAPAESMELLQALIEQLDSPSAVAQIKVFKIINGDANSLIQMLRTLLPEQTGAGGPQLAGAEGEGTLVPVRFSVDTRTNSIIATGSEGDLAIIESLLLRLDAEDVQQRKNMVYSLKNSPAAAVALAINDFLQSQRIVQQAAPGVLNPFQQIESEVVVVPEEVTNSLIISATPRFYEEILEMVERLDEAPAQVMIQVVIAEVELNNLDEFGVELGVQDSILFDRSLLGDLLTTTRTVVQSTDQGIVTVTEDVVQSATNTPGFDFNNNPLGNSGSDAAFARSGNVAGQALSHFALARMNSEMGYGGLVLSASSEGVSVLIRALQETRRLDVLGRPQIMTLDNQPAFIQVGKSVPRIAATRFQANYQTNEIILEPTGLIMGVTPRISPDGTVVMEIDAQKSELGPEAEGIPVSVVEGQIIRQPSINITLAQTTVSAASGETIVLGGLITKKHSNVHRRVPLLADVPVLGNLFRYDNDAQRRSELLIILTPYVIDSADEAERIKRLEAARMSWCLGDVHEIHGPIGVECDADNSGWRGEGEVIYPDLNPRGQKSGEYVPKQVSPRELRLSPTIESVPTPAPSQEAPKPPASGVWNPLSKLRKPKKPTEPRPVPQAATAEEEVAKTSWSPGSQLGLPGASPPAYDVLPTQFFAPPGGGTASQSTPSIDSTHN